MLMLTAFFSSSPPLPCFKKHTSSGQLRDLLLLFAHHGFPSHRGGDVESVSYVFNGDFVDRGAHQLEVPGKCFMRFLVEQCTLVIPSISHYFSFHFSFHFHFKFSRPFFFSLLSTYAMAPSFLNVFRSSRCSLRSSACTQAGFGFFAGITSFGPATRTRTTALWLSKLRYVIILGGSLVLFFPDELI